MGHSKTLSSGRSQIIFITLFSAGAHGIAAPFTSHSKLSNYAELKPFSSTKPAYFGFSSSNCTVQDHIQSTPPDALSSRKRPKNKFYFGHVKIVNMFFFQ